MEPVIQHEDILYISDDRTWVDAFMLRVLESFRVKFVKLPSQVPIRQSWQRFKNAQYIFIHWEGRDRKGGAIVEEIIDVDNYFDVANRIIIITSEPTREDVVYFGELGIKKIVRLRSNSRYFEQAFKLMKGFVSNTQPENPINVQWRKVLRAIDILPSEVAPEQLEKLHDKIERLRSEEGGMESARYLDASGSIHAKKGEFEKAKALFSKALEQNSQYFRSYNNLIKLHISQNELDSAIALCRKMQSLNRENISRLVDIGDIYYKKGEPERAEGFYKSALQRDGYCSRALNGLAQVLFDRGDIQQSRALLAKSNLAYLLAKSLNDEGIHMVSQERYEEALEHYSKAQYVIPLQDKGPMLFYNIGLCYSRWGKLEMAEEFLKIALIKEPNYKKAQNLLEHVQSQLQNTDKQKTA